VIALANSDAFLRSTAQRALETCTGRAAPAPIVANTIVIPPQQTSDYEGTYAQPRRWTIEVVRSGDALILKQFGKEFPLLRVAAAMQSGHDRLKPADQQIERKELAAVRVPGELQIDAETACVLRGLGAMRQQNSKCISRRAGERGSSIRFVRIAACRIGDAGDDEIPVDDAVFIPEKCQAETLELFHPVAGVPVVLVIAGDDEHAVARAQIPQRFDRVAQIIDMAVDEITGDDDRVSFQRVGALDQRFDEAALNRRADVHIAPLHEAIVEARGDLKQNHTRPPRLHETTG